LNLDPLFELEAQVYRTVEIGGAASLKRTDFHLKGKVAGKINGTYEGVDYGSVFKTKEGEVVYVHVHETITTDKGVIAGVRRGYAVSTGNGYKVRAFVFYNTSIPEFEYLNWTLCYAEGTAGPDGLKLKISAVR